MNGEFFLKYVVNPQKEASSLEIEILFLPVNLLQPSMVLLPRMVQIERFEGWKSVRKNQVNNWLAFHRKAFLAVNLRLMENKRLVAANNLRTRVTHSCARRQTLINGR